MTIIRDDILSKLDPNTKTVILHGCNCFCTMGAGIAKYLKQKYPLIYSVDKGTKYGDRKKLGTFSIAGIHNNLHILNCYTQFDYRRSASGKPPVNYSAIESCLKHVLTLYDGWEIRTPKIGCGLAGGDWAVVEPLFNDILKNQNLKVYEK